MTTILLILIAAGLVALVIYETKQVKGAAPDLGYSAGVGAVDRTAQYVDQAAEGFWQGFWGALFGN
ncbi:MAG TPA: hypothetical protein VKW04_18200 [Planctomycetota bacterium]|nr:hypothetical protein [Planctomycetota bacterium]